MNRKEWMRGEIAAWRSEGVIDAGLAAELTRRYAETESRISWGAVLAGTFGALLIGLGVIALFAANWDCFGRGARAAIALAPVVCCGVVATLSSWNGWKSAFLWEPLGILWALATSAAACLVAQTYQVGGSAPGLVLLVAFLTLPLACLTRSVALTALWPVFAVVWAGAAAFESGEDWPLVFKALGLMALSIPAFVRFQRTCRNKAARATCQWVLGLVYAAGAATAAVTAMPSVAYASRAETYICIFWGSSLAVLLAGRLFRIPSWPLVATLVASGAAMPTAGEDLWIYVAALGLALAVGAAGIRRMRLTYTNIGAVLFLVLVLSKFFASRADFTLKGLVLIGTGLALTALNVAMLKFKRRRSAQ